MKYICCKYYKAISFFVVFTAFLFISVDSFAQKPVVIDSTMDADSILIDSSRLHSAKKATLMSAVVPGLGQIYNHKYWKAPVIYAAIGGLIYGYTFYKGQEKFYRDKLTANSTKGNAEYQQHDPTSLQAGVDFYQRNKELMLILLGGTYVLNIVDATVDAYLFDFDVSKDLSLHLSPVMLNSYSFGVACNFYFK